MGAQWKHSGQVANSAKKGALISKLVKEIMVAAKGGSNPDGNPRLRAAIETAKKASVTRDTIERAVKKGSGALDDTVNYESVTYEGFAPHQVPVIVECLTENRNRTAADVRMLFRKAQLGSTGSVAWMFNRMGIIEGTFAKSGFDIEGAAIEAGAQNVEPLQTDIPQGHTGALFETKPEDLVAVSEALTKMGWSLSCSELGWVAKNFVEVSPDKKNEVIEFLDDINEHDDVHRVYAGFK